MGLVEWMRGRRVDAHLGPYQKSKLRTKIDNEVTRSIAANCSSISSGFFVTGTIGGVISYLIFLASSAQKATLLEGMPAAVIAGSELAEKFAYAILALGLFGWLVFNLAATLTLRVFLEHEQ